MCTRTGTPDGGENPKSEAAYPTGAAVLREGRRVAWSGAMGKYMRNCREEEAVGAMEVTQAVGVRTRSRAAAANVVVSKRRKALPDSPAGDAAAAASSLLLLGGESGSCYLKLRSRMLFMAPPPLAPDGAKELAAGLSRCSSTASSSVDAAAAQDRNLPCGSHAAKAGGGCGHVLEGSASNNSESGLHRERERRETTPSSHLSGDLSDLESDLAGQNRSWSLSQTPTTQVQATARVRIPPAVEIEEFFAAAEEAKAKRFASKYNFDVARGVPLDAGRFEWTPVVSSS